MAVSKHLPPFTFDVLCYLNRDQLERFSIVCRSLKNIIDRYFQSNPVRVFDNLRIRGGLYCLCNNVMQWHPNDCSVRQFLAGIHRCDAYHSFDQMRPYFSPTVRIRMVSLYVTGHFTYNPEHISEMESIAYLWRNGVIVVYANDDNSDGRIIPENFEPILNSPTILKSQILYMDNAQFSFKDYKVLYTLKVIDTYYDEEEINSNSWPEFLEQLGVKPLVVLRYYDRKSIDFVIDRISKAFSSAVLPNVFKIVFSLHSESTQYKESLTEFRETNNASSKILELKKGLPTEYQPKNLKETIYKSYTLERSSV